MARRLWFVELLKKSFSARFLFAKSTHAPGFREIADHMFFKGDNISYLHKDRLIEGNEPVDQPEDFVLPTEVVYHFLNKASFHWLMDFCTCRGSVVVLGAEAK